MFDALDHIGSFNHGEKFVQLISKETGRAYRDRWIENVRTNKDRIKNHGWAAERFQELYRGQTAVLLGGSPAVKKQLETLKTLQYDPGFVFIGVHSCLKLFLDYGINLKYCMIADADPEVDRFWEDLDMNKTKDMVLLANVCTAPNLLDMWKGDISFIAYYSTESKLDNKCKKWFNPINGCGRFFYALCSQYNAATAFAALVFECLVLIFVGNELSFKTQETPYYADRVNDIKDTWPKKPQINIYGQVAYTNYMLMSLKLALEDFLGKLQGGGWFFNCTEAGIFGVTKEGNIPWIHQLTLKNGIAQARSIMNTGKPMYSN